MSRPATSPPRPPHDVTEAFQRIRDHGGRVTAAKRALAELLYRSDQAYSADEISDLMPGTERSVVYRCLAQFEALGIAEHVHLGHGGAVYRRRGLGVVPVTCVLCGATVDVDAADLQSLVESVAHRAGMTIDLVHSPLSGRCRRCVDAAHR